MIDIERTIAEQKAELTAILERMWETGDLVIPAPDPEPVLDDMRARGPQRGELWMCIEGERSEYALALGAPKDGRVRVCPVSLDLRLAVPGTLVAEHGFSGPNVLFPRSPRTSPRVSSPARWPGSTRGWPTPPRGAASPASSRATASTSNGSCPATSSASAPTTSAGGSWPRSACEPEIVQ